VNLAWINIEIDTMQRTDPPILFRNPSRTNER
jgi:hypothetical protein